LTFSDPNILGGGWPSPGFAFLQLVVVWQAKKAVAEKEAAEEAAEKVRSSWMRSPSHCERHVPMSCVATSVLITHECAV
jgi:hypothetical protein